MVRLTIDNSNTVTVAFYGSHMNNATTIYANMAFNNVVRIDATAYLYCFDLDRKRQPGWMMCSC